MHINLASLYIYKNATYENKQPLCELITYDKHFHFLVKELYFWQSFHCKAPLHEEAVHKIGVAGQNVTIDRL